MDITEISTSVSDIIPGTTNNEIQISVENTGSNNVFLDNIALSFKQSGNYVNDFFILQSITPNLPVTLLPGSSNVKIFNLCYQVKYGIDPLPVSIEGSAIGTDITFGYPLYTENDIESDYWAIEDIYIPNLLQPIGDYVYLEGSEDNIIEWNFFDHNPSEYRIERENTGIINQSGIWDNNHPILFNVDGLSKGQYRYNIFVNDSSGNTAHETILVYVSDEELSLNHPIDIEYIVGTLGHTNSWLPQKLPSLNEDGYQILKNGEPYKSGLWTHNDPIIVNLDGLDYGIYEFTCIIYADNAASNSTTFNVTVRNDEPQISTPSILNLPFNPLNIYLSWEIDDLAQYLPTYIISQNGTEINRSTCDNISEINYALPTNAGGDYNYSIIFTDGLGGIAQSWIYVSIMKNYPPLLSQPSDMTFVVGTSGRAIVWIIQDDTTSFSTYNIKKNNVRILSDQWINNQEIIVNLTNIAAGEYNYSIEIQDGYGEMVSDLVFIHVLPPPEPEPKKLSFYSRIGIGIGSFAGLSIITRFGYRKWKSNKNSDKFGKFSDYRSLDDME